MRLNNINKTDPVSGQTIDIELLLQQHTRRCVEQELLDEGDAMYSTYLRRANTRHYAATAFAAVVMVAALWGVTPQVSAQATSHASLTERSEAIATSDIIIQNL